MVLCRLYDSRENADFTIIAGEEKRRISVHKFILQQSSYFGKSLQNSPSLLEIQLPNYDASEVEAVVRFLYTGTMPRGSKTASGGWSTGPSSENILLNSRGGCILLGSVKNCWRSARIWFVG